MNHRLTDEHLQITERTRKFDKVIYSIECSGGQSSYEKTRTSCAVKTTHAAWRRSVLWPIAAVSMVFRFSWAGSIKTPKGWRDLSWMSSSRIIHQWSNYIMSWEYENTCRAAHFWLLRFICSGSAEGPLTHVWRLQARIVETWREDANI